jgi:hypothetical protein
MNEGAQLITKLREAGWKNEQICEALDLRSTQAIRDYQKKHYAIVPARLEALRELVAKTFNEPAKTNDSSNGVSNGASNSRSLTTLDYLNRMKNGLDSIARMANDAHTGARSLMKPGLQQFKTRVESLRNELEV